MFDRKFFITLLLTTATFVALQFLFFKDQPKEQPATDVASGQAFKVPTVEELQKPLNREVDFIDTKISKEEQIISVETDDLSCEFTNFGGAISKLAFKKYLGKNKTPLRVVQHQDIFHKEEAAFLVALGEKTPYIYEFVSTNKTDFGTQVILQATTSDAKIKKIFVIPNNGYKIGLQINVECTKPSQLRLFVPAPLSGEILNDTQSGISYNSSTQTLNVITQSQEADAWKTPELFGTNSRYFVNALISDKDHFAIRGYFKRADNRLHTILESQEITQNAIYNLEFYCGPKEISTLSAADTRLEGVLNFGWLSWICKLILKILEWLYSFAKNWGLAIILFTILVKIPLLPLTLKSSAIMENYQKYQPTINRIRQKYRHDLQLQHAEIMKFHKEHNLSPATPMIGCLPLLIDMPIMIALWRVLGDYIGLYGAPFCLWISDLSVRDPYFVMPVLMGATMLWQQMLAPMIDGKQKVMMIFITLFMTVVFANFAAGLVLYWLTKNILTIGETFLRKRIF